MAQISSHLNEKSYSVALATSPDLPLRKWEWERADVKAKSALGAALRFGNVTGSHTPPYQQNLGLHHGVVYHLDGGRFAYVAEHS